MKIALAIAVLVLTAGCGEYAGNEGQDCVNEGGRVTSVGFQRACVVDGAVVAEWEEYE